LIHGIIVALAGAQERARWAHAAPRMVGWELPPCFAELRTFAGISLNKGAVELLQVLRLLETSFGNVSRRFINRFAYMGTVSFDAFSLFQLCRIEQRRRGWDL